MLIFRKISRLASLGTFFDQSPDFLDKHFLQCTVVVVLCLHNFFDARGRLLFFTGKFSLTSKTTFSHG